MKFVTKFNFYFLPFVLVIFFGDGVLFLGKFVLSLSISLNKEEMYPSRPIRCSLIDEYIVVARPIGQAYEPKTSSKTSVIPCCPTPLSRFLPNDTTYTGFVNGSRSVGRPFYLRTPVVWHIRI